MGAEKGDVQCAAALEAAGRQIEAKEKRRIASRVSPMDASQDAGPPVAEAAPDVERQVVQAAEEDYGRVRLC